MIANLVGKPREGIDAVVALTHLGVVQTSFEPTAEHKEAAVAYLASLWFEDLLYDIERPEWLKPVEHLPTEEGRPRLG